MGIHDLCIFIYSERHQHALKVNSVQDFLKCQLYALSVTIFRRIYMVMKPEEYLHISIG